MRVLGAAAARYEPPDEAAAALFCSASTAALACSPARRVLPYPSIEPVTDAGCAVMDTVIGRTALVPTQPARGSAAGRPDGRATPSARTARPDLLERKGT